MTETVLLPLLLTIVGGFLGGVFTWAIARRKTSGKIGTSDAETLWEHAGKIRQEQRDELVEQAEIRKELRAEIVTLRSDLSVLQADLASARLQMAQLSGEAEELREENRILRAENDLLRQGSP